MNDNLKAVLTEVFMPKRLSPKATIWAVYWAASLVGAMAILFVCETEKTGMPSLIAWAILVFVTGYRLDRALEKRRDDLTPRWDE